MHMGHGANFEYEPLLPIDLLLRFAVAACMTSALAVAWTALAENYRIINIEQKLSWRRASLQPLGHHDACLLCTPAVVTLLVFKFCFPCLLEHLLWPRICTMLCPKLALHHDVPLLSILLSTLLLQTVPIRWEVGGRAGVAPMFACFAP